MQIFFEWLHNFNILYQRALIRYNCLQIVEIRESKTEFKKIWLILSKSITMGNNENKMHWRRTVYDEFRLISLRPGIVQYFNEITKFCQIHRRGAINF